jgi:hypothetical protein
MADNANPTKNQDRQQSQDSQQKRPAGEQVRAHERPMDDPGRGHGDVLEDELPKQSDENAGRGSGQRGSS